MNSVVKYEEDFGPWNRRSMGEERSQKVDQQGTKRAGRLRDGSGSIQARSSRGEP